MLRSPGLATLTGMGYPRAKAEVRAFVTRRNARELVLTFDQCLLQRALDDANGVVETAAIMLMSADQFEAAGGAVDPATGVDLANVVESRRRTRSRH